MFIDDLKLSLAKGFLDSEIALDDYLIEFDILELDFLTEDAFTIE